jgi:ADP-ribose pyrophosphatase
MEKNEKKISSQEIYKGHILNLFVDQVKLPNGDITAREVIRHCKAAAILAFDEAGRVILEDQFRYPYDTILTEIPAGKCEPNEDPILTAKRELEEETGYKAVKIEELGQFYPSVAYTDEVIYLYMATGLVKTSQHLDKDEDLDFYKVSFPKLLELIETGKIRDGKTVAAVMQYILKYKKIR